MASDYKLDAGQVAGNLAGGALSGAAAGSAAGPIGTAVGAAGGLIAGGLQTASQNAQLKAAMEQQQQLQDELDNVDNQFNTFRMAQNMQGAQAARQAGLEAEQAAARGGLTGASSAALQQSAGNDAARNNALNQANLAQVALQHRLAAQQSILNNATTAQSLATQNAPNSDIMSGLANASGAAGELLTLAANNKARNAVTTDSGGNADARSALVNQAASDVAGRAVDATRSPREAGAVPSAVALNPDMMGALQGGGQLGAGIDGKAPDVAQDSGVALGAATGGVAPQEAASGQTGAAMATQAATGSAQPPDRATVGGGQDAEQKAPTEMERISSEDPDSNVSRYSKLEARNPELAIAEVVQRGGDEKMARRVMNAKSYVKSAISADTPTEALMNDPEFVNALSALLPEGTNVKFARDAQGNRIILIDDPSDGE